MLTPEVLFYITKVDTIIESLEKVKQKYEMECMTPALKAIWEKRCALLQKIADSKNPWKKLDL